MPRYGGDRMYEELPLNYRRMQSALGIPTPEQRARTGLAERWHKAQADPSRDSAAKKLARARGQKTVSCVCGCDAEFPAEVRNA